MSCEPLFRRSVNEMEVIEILFTAHFKNQLHRLVNHFSGSCVGPINLVNDNNRLESCLECLAKHESSLRHWPFGGVDEQQSAVGHFQHTFDFATKVGVAWCVNDIDFDTFVGQRNVLCENGNSTFFFDISRIKNAFALQLRFPKLTALTKKAIDQSRFPVIDVGNNDDVSNVFTLGHGIAFVLTLLVVTAVCPKKAEQNG